MQRALNLVWSNGIDFLKLLLADYQKTILATLTQRRLLEISILENLAYNVTRYTRSADGKIPTIINIRQNLQKKGRKSKLV